jgi:hypothetical protein
LECSLSFITLNLLIHSVIHRKLLVHPLTLEVLSAYYKDHIVLNPAGISMPLVFDQPVPCFLCLGYNHTLLCPLTHLISSD